MRKRPGNLAEFLKTAVARPVFHSVFQDTVTEDSVAYKAKWMQSKKAAAESVTPALCFKTEVITEVTTLSITRMLQRERTLR